MAFRSKVLFTDDQLASDGESPEFVRAIDERLRREYPDYTIGTWVEFEGQGWVQWSVVAVSGAAHGFRVFFRLPSKNPAAAKAKVVRFSRITGFLFGVTIVLGLVVGVVMAVSGQGSVIAAALMTMAAGLGLSLLLSGTIARALGKALPEEELQKVGQLVLETLEQEPR